MRLTYAIAYTNTLTYTVAILFLRFLFSQVLCPVLSYCAKQKLNISNELQTSFVIF